MTNMTDTADKVQLFSTVRAERRAYNVWEVIDIETRFFVTEDEIALHADYDDDAEGDGYAAWCRDSSVVTGLGQYGIDDRGCTPEWFAAIAAALDVDDERRAYAVARAVNEEREQMTIEEQQRYMVAFRAAVALLNHPGCPNSPEAENLREALALVSPAKFERLYFFVMDIARLQGEEQTVSMICGLISEARRIINYQPDLAKKS